MRVVAAVFLSALVACAHGVQLRSESMAKTCSPSDGNARVLDNPKSAHFLGADPLTKGNWLEPQRYGSLGGVLFAANGGSDVRLAGSAHLEIQNTKYIRQMALGTNLGDSRALLFPGTQSNPVRGLGYITNGTMDADGRISDLILEVGLRGSTHDRYRLSLYVCDWDRGHGLLGVSVWNTGFDEPKVPAVTLWPTQPIGATGISMGDGVWLNFYVPSNTRVTIKVATADQMNTEPFLNAIMLDPYPC